MDPNDLTVMGPEGEVAIASRSDDGKNIYTLVPDEPLDVTAEYFLICNGVEYPITMPIYYSIQAFETLYTYEGDDTGATWSLVKAAESESDMEIIIGGSKKSSIGIIGGADGPTAVFVSGNWGGMVSILAAVICAGVAVVVVPKNRKK